MEAIIDRHVCTGGKGEERKGEREEQPWGEQGREANPASAGRQEFHAKQHWQATKGEKGLKGPRAHARAAGRGYTLWLRRDCALESELSRATSPRARAQYLSTSH